MVCIIGVVDMFKSKHIFYLIIGSLLIFFASCKTTPDVVEDSDTGMLENLAKEAEKARAEAIKNGADTSYPDLFKIADKKLNDSKSIVKTKKNEAIKGFKEATKMYQSLSNLAMSQQLKKEIDDLGFVDYDPDKYGKAQKLYDEALNKYGKDMDSSLTSSSEALSLFHALCDIAYTDLADKAKQMAKEAKEKCDSIKASRNITASYNQAVQLYNNGSVYFNGKHYREAHQFYMESFNTFNKTYETAEAKRKEALSALARAKAKMNESSSLAGEADRASPLKGNAEGFGEVDTSSLENRDSEKGDVDEIKD